MKLNYYWVNDLHLVGRVADDLENSDFDENGKAIVPFDGVYRNGEWDESYEARRIVNDRLKGYDEFEPDDSPYAMGNSDMMDRIEGITEEEAMKRITEADAKRKGE